MQKKKGISLIVLVITIIIMIILAGAIIITLNNSGIIDKATEAVEKTNQAILKTMANTYLGEYIILQAEGKTGGKTATKYVQEKTGSTELFVNANMQVVLYSELKIGDVVEYDGAVAATYTTTGAENPETDPITADKNVNSVKGAQTYTTTAAEQDELEWIYIGQDENGNHLITTTSPVNKTFYMFGSGGYVNGLTELNKMCKALYGPNQKVARNMTIEDINRILNYTGPKGRYYDTEDHIVETVSPITITQAAEEIGYDMTDFESITPEIGKNIGDYLCDGYGISKTSDKITADEDIKNIVFKDTKYWLASSCAFAVFYYNSACFYVHYVCDNRVSGYDIFYSYGGSNCGGYAVRPVVSI